MILQDHQCAREPSETRQIPFVSFVLRRQDWRARPASSPAPTCPGANASGTLRSKADRCHRLRSQHIGVKSRITSHIWCHGEWPEPELHTDCSVGERLGPHGTKDAAGQPHQFSARRAAVHRPTCGQFSERAVMNLMGYEDSTPSTGALVPSVVATKRFVTPFGEFSGRPTLSSSRCSSTETRRRYHSCRFLHNELV